MLATYLRREVRSDLAFARRLRQELTAVGIPIKPFMA
jgi:hypothetical protein